MLKSVARLAAVLLALACLPAAATVVQVYGATPPTWIGLSTDVKPINTVKKGSLFIETDTSRNYRWTGSEAIGTSSDWTRSNLAVSLDTALSYEDTTNSVAKVEQQFSYKPILHTDTQVKASAGFIHTITCNSSDAAATAGSIAVLDATSAGTGTNIITYNILAQNYLPWTSVLDVVTTTGIYVDFTTTGDIDCVVSYR